MEDLIEALNADTSDTVKIWMNWMMLVFLASIIYIWKFAAARWSLFAFISTGVFVYFIWDQTQNVHLFGIAHLVFWGPLMIYVWKRVLSKSPSASAGFYERCFRIWTVILVMTIFVSLLFDIRDIYLVAMGAK